MWNWSSYTGSSTRHSIPLASSTAGAGLRRRRHSRAANSTNPSATTEVATVSTVWPVRSSGWSTGGDGGMGSHPVDDGAGEGLELRDQRVGVGVEEPEQDQPVRTGVPVGPHLIEDLRGPDRAHVGRTTDRQLEGRGVPTRVPGRGVHEGADRRGSGRVRHQREHAVPEATGTAGGGRAVPADEDRRAAGPRRAGGAGERS